MPRLAAVSHGLRSRALPAEKPAAELVVGGVPRVRIVPDLREDAVLDPHRDDLGSVVVSGVDDRKSSLAVRCAASHSGFSRMCREDASRSSFSRRTLVSKTSTADEVLKRSMILLRCARREGSTSCFPRLD